MRKTKRPAIARKLEQMFKLPAKSVVVSYSVGWPAGSVVVATPHGTTSRPVVGDNFKTLLDAARSACWQIEREHAGKMRDALVDQQRILGGPAASIAPSIPAAWEPYVASSGTLTTTKNPAVITSYWSNSTVIPVTYGTTYETGAVAPNNAGFNFGPYAPVGEPRVLFAKGKPKKKRKPKPKAPDPITRGRAIKLTGPLTD